MTFSCTCNDGYRGKFCDEAIDFCQPGPLGPCSENTEECTSLETFICKCKPGFVGETCENFDLCAENNPCYENSTCDTDFGRNRVFCICGPERTGRFCEKEITPCHSNPCLHGGDCEEPSSLEYICNCKEGFWGDVCQDFKDDCLDANCVNFIACTDLGNDFKCYCKDGHTGKLCDVKIAKCDYNSCAERGSCVLDVEENKTSCLCSLNFTGDRCDVPPDYCQNNTCNEEYTVKCENRIEEQDYVCVCDENYSGENCDIYTEPVFITMLKTIAGLGIIGGGMSIASFMKGNLESAKSKKMARKQKVNNIAKSGGKKKDASRNKGKGSSGKARRRVK